ncbi:MAG: cytochrome c, partial [Bacteroidetes bacterium]
AYGTYAIPGHKPYMPHYPLERMSKQQVEDLRAYIEQQCELF